MGVFFSSCGDSTPSPNNSNPSHAYGLSKQASQIINTLNFSPGKRCQSGSSIYWMVNTSKLIDETYIKWGKSTGNLEYTGKKHFATLSLYNDKLAIPSDGLYYLEIVAKIDGKELLYGPFPFYGKQSSQMYSPLPQQLRLTQDQTQGERTVQIPPEGTYREYETNEQWTSGDTTSGIQSHLWMGVKTAGEPCTVGAVVTYTPGGTTSGSGLCNNNNLTFEWDQMIYDASYAIEEDVPSYNIDSKSSGTYHKEINNIASSIIYQLPTPRAYEMIKSVIIMPTLYNIMDSNVQYTLGEQIPNISGDIQCPEQQNNASNGSCTNYAFSDYGVTCVNTECNSGSGFSQPPCTALLTWDVSALTPTMGGPLQLELKGSESLPISYEGNWSDSSNVACDNNFTETYSDVRSGDIEENYIKTGYGQLPWASVTYKCEQKYIINIFGDLTYGYFIPPDIEPNVSAIDIPVQLKPVCENEDVSNKALVFDIKRVDSSNEYENGGHSHDHATVSTAIGFFDNNTCTTDSGGSCDVTWHPPEASGFYELKVYVDGETDVANTQRFMVGVEGLTSLVSSPYYRLTGQRPAHPDNHWAMEDVIGYIQQMSSEYDTYYNATLGINDMSLIYGGLFDISADWNIPHSLHRLGRSVDIDRCAKSTVDPNVTDPYCLSLKYPKGFKKVSRDEIGRFCAEHGYGHLEREAPIHCEYPPALYTSSGGDGGCGDHPCM